ncbi:uncharacterized protein [Rutidosis leptorrhynchoides]|uniref:uncharacterized protein n=1 Tax=Rutidosis leptorrhynchoides TaxID=125765 RepID=UPI003A9A5FA0
MELIKTTKIQPERPDSWRWDGCNKVEVFVWRVLKKWLPVLVELDKWGIDLHSVRCSICDNDIESVDHSLGTCKEVNDLWRKVLDWWGFMLESHDLALHNSTFAELIHYYVLNSHDNPVMLESHDLALHCLIL